jgi:hypothetical protein
MSTALRVALAVSVSSGLYAAGVVLAPAATPFLLLVPLPGLVLATLAPLLTVGLWLVLTTSAIAMLLGGDAAPGFVLPFALPALVLAVGVQRPWSFERTVLAGIAAWCIGIAGVLLLAYGYPAAVAATAREQLTHSVDLALSTYGSIGRSEGAASLLEANREALVTGLVEIIPALVVLTGALTILLNVVLIRNWSPAARGVNLRLWRTPDQLIWLLIVTGFAMFAPAPPVAVAARNVFIIVLGCYFCQGLAIVSYYLERYRLPRGIRIAGYALIAVQHVIAALVLVLGVFDLWGNFRRLNAGAADVPFHSDND